MKILVTGANGFVGSHLIPLLLKQGHHVTALVRSKKNLKNPSAEVKWLEGDLLDPETLPELKDIDKAFFLVHGLRESSNNFENQEALTAVNFINWVRPSNPTLIYLGGLGPKLKDLSPHLRSRHLAGAILGASGLPTIEFRASIVLGEGSLSFEMIKALSERLPFRPDFSLLSQPCQPISLPDLLDYLSAALKYSADGHEIIEIGGPDVATYGELLDLYAELSKLKRKRIKLPEVEAKVLIKALDYSIPEYAQSGKKLVESLEYPTVVDDESAKEAFPDIEPKDLRKSMLLAYSSSKTHYSPLWEKDFLKVILSDKILTQSGFFSPDLLKNLERVTKIKDVLSRK